MGRLVAILLAGCTGTPPSDRPSTDDGAPTGGDSSPDTDTAADPADDTGTGDTHTEVTPGLAGLAEIGVRNVVFVHVDTLRADHLPRYGSEHDTMPLSGTLPWMVVDGLHPVTSWTVPSTTSVLTSLTMAHHGITHTLASGEMNAPMVWPTVARTFGQAGFATMVLSGNQALPLVDGIFDDFDDVDPDLVGSPGTNLGWEVTDTLAWLDGLPDGQPFFVFLQPMNVHSPYEPDADHLGTWSDPETLPFSVDATEDEQLAAYQAAYDAATTDEERAAVIAQLRAIYDEDVLGVDEGIWRLKLGLEERGLGADTLIVLAGDHGETLGEELSAAGKSYFGHGGKTRPELVHVPLMFHHPALPPATVDCLSSNVDVMPTILAALGLPAMDGVDGRPLQDGCRDVVGSSTFLNDRDSEDPGELSVTDGVSMLRWNCFSHTEWRYDLDADPTGLDSVPLADFAPRDALVTEMDAFLAELSDGLGTVSCTVEP